VPARVGDRALCAQATPWAASVAIVDPDGRRRLLAPAAPELTVAVDRLLPEAKGLDVSELWRALLPWPVSSWTESSVAARIAAATGVSDASGPGAAVVGEVADLLVDRWHYELAVVRGAYRGEPLHLVAATGISPRASSALGQRTLLTAALAGREARVVCADLGRAGAEEVAVLLEVPALVAGGLSNADLGCRDLGPVHPGDGERTWQVLSAVWQPGRAGPLADPLAALAAARAVATEPTRT
jgi:hypothetical protein